MRELVADARPRSRAEGHPAPPKSVNRRRLFYYEAHEFPYIPGIFASITDAGRGDNQRSGFHSSASSPHMSLAVLHPRQLGSKNVPFGIGISVIRAPSTPRIGFRRGMTTSSVVSRGTMSIGAYLAYFSGLLVSDAKTHKRNVSRQTESSNGSATSWSYGISSP